MPLGGLPTGTRPVGSCGCQVHVPSEVPTISRYETMRNAPAYTSGLLPNRLNTSRHPNQNAPSRSFCGDSVSPHTAQAPHAVSVTGTSQVERCAHAERPMARAAR